uniref:Uncharacterized protein n=1 Tax=Chryseobacterium endophyticum TaxID=1854762 RepID=A0AAU6WLY3_9FLAO
MNLIFEKADNRVYDYIAYLDDIEIGEAEDNVGGPGSEFLIFCNNKIFKFSEVYNIADFLKRIYVYFHYQSILSNLLI